MDFLWLDTSWEELCSDAKLRFFNNPNPGSEEEAWAADMVMADETTCCFGLRKTHEGTGNMAASISAKCFVGTLESMTKVSKGRDVEDLALACTKLTDRTPALQLRFQWRQLLLLLSDL